MKKIVLFDRWLPDIIEAFMKERNLNRFSPGLRCHPDLIKMVESARVVTHKDFMNDDFRTELKRTGELACNGHMFGSLYSNPVNFAYGYNVVHKEFCDVCVYAYDETRRYFFSEIDGREFIFDLDRLGRSSYLPTEYNLWNCIDRTVV